MSSELDQSESLESWRGRAVAALAGGLAHDLNNLLSATFMLVELLAEEPIEDRALVAAVGDSSKRGIGLVRQLLWLARGYETEGRFQIRYVLNDLLRALQATLPPDVSATADLAADPWLLEGGPHASYRLLFGLFEEARRQLGSGGGLRLAARNEPVDDLAAAQRPGLSPGPYVRIELDVQPGSVDFPLPLGLGEMEHQTLARAGGFWEASAPAADRRVVRVFLPALPPPEQHRKELDPTDGERSGGGGRLLLIAEGDPAVRLGMARVLRKGGFEILEASDGAEAVGLFAEHRTAVSALVVGTGLAFLDPPALLRAVRRLRPDLPALAIGGPADLRNLPRGPAGPDLLEKPFSGAQLLTAVDGVLARAGV